MRVNSNQTYFYMGADYGIPILILVAIIVFITTAIGILLLMTVS